MRGLNLRVCLLPFLLSVFFVILLTPVTSDRDAFLYLLLNFLVAICLILKFRNKTLNSFKVFLLFMSVPFLSLFFLFLLVFLASLYGSN